MILTLPQQARPTAGDAGHTVGQGAALHSRPLVNARFPERPCDKCGKPYRGPAVYCSLTCALADA